MANENNDATVGRPGAAADTTPRLETLALHAGYDGDPATKAAAVPIYQTVAYRFDSAEHGAALFNLEAEGHIYSRLSNPTNAVLEQRVAALEGGVAAVAVSSGMTAVQCALANLVEAGDNFISLPQLYGRTHTLFLHIFAKQGVEARFAASDAPAAIEPLMDARTRAVFCESVGNPAGNIADLAALAEIAHRHGVPLIVDNTVATPVLLRPIAHGADVVLHAATKFLCGHGTTLGGIIVDGGRFDWRAHADRFPMFSRPEPAYHGVVYTDHYGDAAFAARCRTVGLGNGGAVLAPFNAFLILQGIETLALRIERHVANGRRVAEFLAAHPQVAWVSHTAFPDHPSYSLARRYLGNRDCSLLTFGVKGGFEAGRKCVNALRLFQQMVNLGDAKSLACHPASTTHRQMSPTEQAKAGVTPEMLRLSVGIEHIDDILADLAQALTAARPPA
ncbi:MAG: O-acetylhomoserine aminocarboxypropyltransferase/cysteine synthase family protein [Terriglobales bacterium]